MILLSLGTSFIYCHISSILRRLGDMAESLFSILVIAKEVFNRINVAIVTLTGNIDSLHSTHYGLT